MTSHLVNNTYIQSRGGERSPIQKGRREFSWWVQGFWSHSWSRFWGFWRNATNFSCHSTPTGCTKRSNNQKRYSGFSWSLECRLALAIHTFVNYGRWLSLFRFLKMVSFRVQINKGRTKARVIFFRGLIKPLPLIGMLRRGCPARLLHFVDVIRKTLELVTNTWKSNPLFGIRKPIFISILAIG